MEILYLIQQVKYPQLVQDFEVDKQKISPWEHLLEMSMISVFVRRTYPRKVLRKEKVLRVFIPNMTLFILDIVSQRQPTVVGEVEITTPVVGVVLTWQLELIPEKACQILFTIQLGILRHPDLAAQLVLVAEEVATLDQQAIKTN